MGNEDRESQKAVVLFNDGKVPRREWAQEEMLREESRSRTGMKSWSATGWPGGIFTFEQRLEALRSMETKHREAASLKGKVSREEWPGRPVAAGEGPGGDPKDDVFTFEQRLEAGRAMETMHREAASLKGSA